MATRQARTQQNTLSVIERLQAAQNRSDLETFLDCFDPKYQSEQPLHPDRAFGGREQVRKNWSAIFSGITGFRSEIIAYAIDGDTGWAEWYWTGTYTDGRRFAMRGVTIFGVQDNRIIWGRLYMEPVQESGTGIDAHIQTWVGGASRED